jgi:GTP cyclohydrolase IA
MSNKIKKITNLFTEILWELGLDLKDPNLKDTPSRIAKMYVNEIFSSINKTDKDINVTVFDNTQGFDQMVCVRNMDFTTTCAHHFLPFIGYATIAYIPTDKVLGLSKFSRIVNHFAAKPQVQENLTQEIANFIIKVLQTQDVAVVMVAKHECMQCRGVKLTNSDTITSYLGGSFREGVVRQEFLDLVKLPKA